MNNNANNVIKIDDQCETDSTITLNIDVVSNDEMEEPVLISAMSEKSDTEDTKEPIITRTISEESGINKTEELILANRISAESEINDMYYDSLFTKEGFYDFTEIFINTPKVGQKILDRIFTSQDHNTHVIANEDLYYATVDLDKIYNTLVDLIGDDNVTVREGFPDSVANKNRVIDINIPIENKFLETTLSFRLCPVDQDHIKIILYSNINYPKKKDIGFNVLCISKNKMPKQFILTLILKYAYDNFNAILIEETTKPSVE